LYSGWVEQEYVTGIQHMQVTLVPFRFDLIYFSVTAGFTYFHDAPLD